MNKAALLRMDSLFQPALRLHQDTEFIVRLAWYARLHAGSIDAPVSIRGVHAKNRITQNKRPLETRHQLFKHLWEWMVRAGVDPVTTERYHFRYRLKELRAASTKLDALRKALEQRPYWKRFDYRDVLFQRLAGNSQQLKALFHKLSWRFFR